MNIELSATSASLLINALEIAISAEREERENVEAQLEENTTLIKRHKSSHSIYKEIKEMVDAWEAVENKAAYPHGLKEIAQCTIALILSEDDGDCDYEEPSFMEIDEDDDE